MHVAASDIRMISARRAVFVAAVAISLRKPTDGRTLWSDVSQCGEQSSELV